METQRLVIAVDADGGLSTREFPVRVAFSERLLAKADPRVLAWKGDRIHVCLSERQWADYRVVEHQLATRLVVAERGAFALGVRMASYPGSDPT